LSAVDAQRIRRIEESRVQGDEATRLAVLCALHMYLNVINLFLFLLRFLGNRR
jgi:FtsH-binding integral membrane protein